MPGPEPNAVWIEHDAWGHPLVAWEVFLVTNRTTRKRRAVALLRNVMRGGWLCPRCGEPVPHFRRVDARFCGEGCRKRAARARRQARAEWQAWRAS